MNPPRLRRISLIHHPGWIWALPVCGALLITFLWAATLTQWQTPATTFADVNGPPDAAVAATMASRAYPPTTMNDIRRNYLLVDSAASVAIAALFAALTMLTLRLQRYRVELKRQGSLLRELIDNVPHAVTVRSMQAGMQGRYVMWNTSSTALSGIARDDALGRIMRDVMPPANAVRFEALDREMLASPMVQELTQAHEAPGGRNRMLHVLRAPIFGPDHQVDYIMSNTSDITEAFQQTEALRLASKVFETTADGIMMSDVDDRILMINQAFSRLTGYVEGDLLGKILAESPFRPLDLVASAARMMQIRQAGFVTGEVARTHKNGSALSLWITGSCVTNAAGEITHFVRVFTDISLLKSTQVTLEQLASYDTLTGLPNRRLLLERLEQAVQRAGRSGATVAIMFVDLDNFKSVNATFGHASGDLLLREAANRMHSCIRTIDNVGRLGGDEFAILLEDIASPTYAALIGDRILSALSAPYFIQGRRVAIAASIGIASYPQGGTDAGTLLGNADIAMYEAKQAGRHCYRFYVPTAELQAQ